MENSRHAEKETVSFARNVYACGLNTQNKLLKLRSDVCEVLTGDASEPDKVKSIRLLLLKRYISQDFTYPEDIDLLGVDVFGIAELTEELMERVRKLSSKFDLVADIIRAVDLSPVLKIT